MFNINCLFYKGCIYVFDFILVFIVDFYSNKINIMN